MSFFVFRCRAQRWTMVLKMCRFVHGKQLRTKVVNLQALAQQMQWEEVYYGCLIMRCHDVPAATQNFGLDGENITAG